MKSLQVDIGYLCGRGHYCFYADPEEGGECGSKKVGTLTLSLDPALTEEERSELLMEASDHLGEVIDTWRNSD